MSGKHVSYDIFEIPVRGADVPDKSVVGSKAHNLMRMARCGLPVPPGFVISTELCRLYLADRTAALKGLDGALAGALAALEAATGREFGNPRRPLLVSVRSGAAISMPGMMETVLNIGLSRDVLGGLVRMTGNPRLVQDCRRRLIQQYGEVVHGIPPARFDQRLSSLLASFGAHAISELGTHDLKGLVAAFEEVFQAEAGERFPEDPYRQLRQSIEAVLASWSSERAQSYRRMNRIPETLGTAVTVQTMVFGNIGPDSGAGVGFTRSPADGSNGLYVDFATNAQGEDVVAGRHTAAGIEALQQRAPLAYRGLLDAKDKLESEFRDMQDFEFTVEDGRLLMLQSRSGKRTPLAALRIAAEMVGEGIVTQAEAGGSLAGIDLDAIEETHLEIPDNVSALGEGTSASVGVAIGAVCFDPARIPALKKTCANIILVRQAAETGDFSALATASALVTAEGARTSHAAVVARQLGKPCVVSVAGLSIDPSGRFASLGSERLEEGAIISVDATEGRIYRGGYAVVTARPLELIEQVRSWSHAPAKKAPVRKRRS